MSERSAQRDPTFEERLADALREGNQKAHQRYLRSLKRKKRKRRI